MNCNFTSLKKCNIKCWELDFLIFCKEREKELRKKERNYTFYTDGKVKIQTYYFQL
jgi:hypothetical protein